MEDNKNNKDDEEQEKKKGKDSKGKGKRQEHEDTSNQFPGDFMDLLKGLFSHATNVEIHSIGVPSALREKKARQTGKKKETDSATAKAIAQFKKLLDFDSTPREIREYLDHFVVSQEQAKRVLSVAICDHYNHVRNIMLNPKMDHLQYAKQNVVLVGPTGCGKTYLMRCLAQRLGVPFVKADATKYSETGYVGYDVEDMVRDLVKAADGNVELAQFGIIYIDEIDKIAGSGDFSGRRDISGRGVQINLLKMMEDAEVRVASQAEMFSPMRMMMNSNQPSTIRTKNILFIVSGAFDRMPEIIRRRLGKSQIGFDKTLNASSDQTDDKLLLDLRTEDFVTYGFEPEFIGRLPARVALSSLSVEDLEKVLTGVEDSFLNQYVESFQAYGIELRVLPEAIHAIASQAAQEKTGARGLLTVLEHLFRNFKFELPGTNCKELVITEDTVLHPEQALHRMLAALT